MSSKVEKIENNQAVLEITVSPEAFVKGIEKAYQKTKGKFSVPGFRKGKVPKSYIEKFYGAEVFFEDAVNEVCPEAYDNAVEEHGIEPVDRPEIDITEISKEAGITFKATVTVKPEVKLGKYKGLKIEKKEFPVTDEDVQGEIEGLRNKNARIVDITDRAVKLGDVTMIDYAGFVGDRQFEGGTATNQKLEIGSKKFIPGFEEQLIGAEIGKEVDVKVTFPEKYQEPTLAGQEAIFKVTVNEIKEKILLEMDDEFAKDVSEFETLEELKADLRAKREEDSAKMAKQAYEDAVIEKVLEGVTVEIPEVMIDTQTNYMLRDFDQQLRYQGLDLKNYLKYMNQTEEGLKETMKEEAAVRVKTQLVLEKITKVEEIKASEADVDAEIEKTAKMYGQEVEKFKEMVKPEDIERISDGLSIQKAVEFLVTNN